MKVQHLIRVTGVALAAVALTACAPGPAPSTSSSSSASAVSKDVAAAGNVTLTVWDINTDGDGNTLQEALNASFSQKYPNVTIKRVERSFTDNKTTIGLALSSPDAPDVAQINQTYSDMGTFVSGKLIRPLGDYAALYGWDKSFPAGQIAFNSYSSDGKHWQQGDLYGLSQTGEIVGVYYNKALLTQAGVALPTTISEFNAALAKVKAAGILPISFGNSEGWPGLHQYGMVQAQLLGAKGVQDLVTGAGGSWTAQPNVDAAAMLQDWASKGYMTADSGGVAPDAARSSFIKGDAAFYISGTWNASDISKGLGDKAGFLVLSPDGTTTPTATGGIGLAFSISTACKHPDVAAAYIDWITNADANLAQLKTGALAAVVPADYTPSGAVQTDILKYWQELNKSDSMVPYLDSSSTTFYDVGTAQGQELIAGKITPEAFVKALQADADSFAKTR